MLEKFNAWLGIKIQRTGLGVLGGNVFFPSAENRYKWLRQMDIKTIIDVGAHKGESALEFHQLIPQAKIYSFEPLRENFLALNKNLAHVAGFQSFQLALGDRQEKVPMHRHQFSASSSLLSMDEMHKQAFPFSAGFEIEEVMMDTMDHVFETTVLEPNPLLKMDCQGFEHKVLEGAQKILPQVRIIFVETSFYRLYKDQPLFHDMYTYLHVKGFVYSGAWGELLQSPQDGRILQENSIFIAQRGKNDCGGK